MEQPEESEQFEQQLEQPKLLQQSERLEQPKQPEQLGQIEQLKQDNQTPSRSHETTKQSSSTSLYQPKV